MTITSLGLMRASVAASSAVEHSVTMNSDVEMSIHARPMRSPHWVAQARECSLDFGFAFAWTAYRAGISAALSINN